MTCFKIRLAGATATGIIMLFSSQGALAESQAIGGYSLRANVPVACWVQPASQVSAEPDGRITVIEACNNPGGFRVSAFYRPLGLTEKAHVVYDGSGMDLAKSGQQLLRSSTGATIRTIDYHFKELRLNAPLVLSLTIQPN